MTKTEAIQVLSDLHPTEKVRLIIDISGLSVDSTQAADYHLFWLKNEFSSPWDENQKEINCIDLVTEKFDTRPSVTTWELFVWYFDLDRCEQNYRKVSHFNDADGFIEFVGKLRKNKRIIDIRIFNFH